MRIIDIAAVPNQSFSVTLEGNRWDFVTKQAVTSMIADILLNDIEILSGIRIVSETPFIPYRYLQAAGNFIILTENEQIPIWRLFGIDQVMVYASPEEIAIAKDEAEAAA